MGLLIAFCLTLSSFGDLAHGAEVNPPSPRAVEGATAQDSKSESDGPAATNTPSDESSAATQVASFATTRLKDSPAVVTVISGEDIRATGARDLIDILYLVPGYFFGVDTEGVVGPGFRGLWGHEGKILLMVDGKEMNELLFSNMQLGNDFPVELIERVEVVRGPGSVIYGGSAELSVINVVTRGLQGSTDAMATATYGEMTDAKSVSTGYGRRRVSASGRLVSDSIPGLSSFASLSVAEGQRSIRTFVDNSGMSGTMEGNSNLNPGLIQLGVGYKDIQASFLYSHMGITSISGSGTTLPMPLPVNFDAYHGELAGTLHIGDRIEIASRLNAIYQTPWQAPNMDDNFYSKAVRRLRARLLGRWAALDQLQVTVGGDAIFDQAHLLAPANANFQTQFGNSDSVSYQTFAGYVELFSENPIVNIAAGARYDHLSSVGGALVPRLVLIKNLGPLSLKGLFSLSFRAPGIENLNGGRDIKPEHTRVFEFEGSYEFTDNHRISANVFDILIDSPIAYAYDPVLNTDGYLNLGRQGTRGFELAYRLRTSLVRLDVNYSFYRPSVSDNVPPYTVPGHSDQFLGAPNQRATVSATAKPWRLFGISPTLIVIAPQYRRGAPLDPMNPASPETSVQIPTQVLANLFVYRENVGAPGLTVGLGFYNIFGTDYHFIHATGATTYVGDHAPLPGLDREVLLRVSYLFDQSVRR
jgi:outer membrane receptor protein involved in Fe transport